MKEVDRTRRGNFEKVRKEMEEALKVKDCMSVHLALSTLKQVAREALGTSTSRISKLEMFCLTEQL